MATEILGGAARKKFIALAEGAAGRLITIELVEGEVLPAGDLVAEATSGEDVVYLVPTETESSGQVTVEVEIFPEDFAAYGSSNWELEVAVDDTGSGSESESSDSASGEGDRYILFRAAVQYREVAPLVIESTTVTTLESSGSSS